MVLTASLSDAPHINMFELGKKKLECICRRVAPDYAADLFYQYWTVAETHEEREIGSSIMYSVHV